MHEYPQVIIRNVLGPGGVRQKMSPDPADLDIRSNIQSRIEPNDPQSQAVRPEPAHWQSAYIYCVDISGQAGAALANIDSNHNPSLLKRKAFNLKKKKEKTLNPSHLIRQKMPTGT